jgi:hypothetical protein
MCEIHIHNLDMGSILRDRLRPPGQSYSTARNPHKGLQWSQVGRDPPYWFSYVVDYKALIGLLLLRVPQQSVWPEAPRAWKMPPPPRRWLCLGPSTFITGKSPLWGMYNCHTGSHCIDDPLDTGPYIQQGNIQFYHTICKCTNNIREVIG